MKSKQTYRLRIISLFLMTLTLIGSVGINADFHICKNEVKDIAFFDLADDCSEMETMLNCDIANSQESSLSKPKCCTNEHVFAKANFENVQSLDITQFKSVVHPSFITLFSVEQNMVYAQTYSEKPPTWQVSSGLHIAFQQFLI